jgi:LemA protein
MITLVLLTGLLFVCGMLAYIALLYNGLIRLRNDNDRAWANIDVLLKQRHDEIPNLVETVKGYMQHEQQTFQMLAEARAAYTKAATVGQKAAADSQVNAALRGLFAVAEGYPELKANQNFLRLQQRISELEDHIADRREFFNANIAAYNTRIAQVPDVILARCLGLKPREMFRVADADRRPMTITLTHSAGR